MDILEALQNEDLDTLKNFDDKEKLNQVFEEAEDEAIKIKTPLTLACEKGNLEAVKILIDNGAEVNKKDGKTIRPLYQACVSGHREIIEHLIEEKADINKPGWNKFVPVHAAIERDDLELLKFLKEKGADLNVSCSRGGLIRHAAYKHCAVKCLSYLLKEEKLDLNTFNEQFKQSVLYEVCYSYLLRLKDEEKSTALLKIVKKLVKAGADVSLKSERDGKEETPLDLAKAQKNEALIEVLSKGSGGGGADDGEECDVFISFHYDSKSTVDTIAKCLNDDNSIRIYNPSDDDERPINEIINKAKVVLICLTEKYEMDELNKFQYEFVSKKKKPFIPLKLEEDFEPRGGHSLDMIMGSKLYYMFTNEEEYEENMPKVVKEIKKILEQENKK
ncbi:poly [ADP-ribose] polymerase tankyrase-2-like [Clytia hemisphaerica]|uniref:poly [ADP-ribose] polymerase tankyrase-2-like n=1 Tax=Clytia hemisphaerica TaxID=252671 RepID=UPI0034D6A3A1|eukprot:TCONS_00062515-protein